jgi:hypothetical protein
MTTPILKIPGFYDRYMRSRCLVMADALSRETGLPIGRLWAPEAGCMGHAFLITDRSVKNREAWLGADVSGIRPVSEMRKSYEETHGRLLFPKDYSEHPIDPRFDEPDEVLLLIAGRIPHLASLLDLKWVEPDPVAAAADIADVLPRIREADRKIMYRGSAQEAWGWTEDWVAQRTQQTPGPKHG